MPSATAIDAATFVLADGRRVRLLGVQAPGRGSCSFVASTAMAQTALSTYGGYLIREPGAGTDEFGGEWVYVQLNSHTRAGPRPAARRVRLGHRLGPHTGQPGL